MHDDRGPVSPVWRFSLIVAAVFFVQACEDGRDGEDGLPGPALPGVTIQATELQVEILDVRIDGAPVVEFQVANESGVPYVGLSAGSVRFALAKLVPGTGGDPDRWQSYINRIERAGSVGPGTADAIQATAERDGQFEDFRTGRYRYRFATDVTQVTTPLAVSFEPTLTHRLAIQISGGTLPASNPVYTWRPADGAVAGIAQRDIVVTETCNACHGRLAFHGGGRTEVAYCVTCHNPGSTDANSGNSVDFTEMVHKIHRGQNLPSVMAGGQYELYGFRDQRHDYSQVLLPQDIRNCVVCHAEGLAEAPQARNWQSRPSAQACGACHDDVDFATGLNHGPTNLVADNGECTVCHSPGGLVGGVDESHRILAREAGRRYQFNILQVTDTAPGQAPELRFSVTDPGQDEAAYDLLADPVWTQTANGASRLFIGFGWSTQEFSNVGSGRPVGQPVTVNALTEAEPDGDGSYRIRSTLAIPDDVAGSGVVSIEGHPAADFDGDGQFTDRVPVTGATLAFPVTDSTAANRRQVVELPRCNACHGQISLHGSNRTDELTQCALCHNPDATDIRRRPGEAASALDGLREQSIDFKYMIHAIHAGSQRESGFVVYGFGGRAHDYGEVVYPRNLANCESCHVPGSFGLPLADPVLATTIDSGSNPADPGDDMNITPAAAVCSSCHDNRLAREHMAQNGASFATPQSLLDNGSLIETCAVCHGPGRQADVSAVHPAQ